MKRRTVLSAFALAPFVSLRARAQAQHGSHADHRAGLAMSSTFSPDGALWIVALNDRRELFVQHSNDVGRTWSAARVIYTDGDTIAADGENRPKLRFGPNGWAVISYTQPLAKPYTGEIRMLRSADGGKTFSAPFTVHRDRQVITHRFESIAFDASGALHTVWIDKRDLEVAKQANAKQANQEAEYVGAALYRNVSLDGGRTFGPDIKVADHTCECCRIALTDDGHGGIAALWRHVFGRNTRDHAFASIAGGGKQVSPVTRASFDEWRIDACPHHGPGLALAADGGFHAVWFGMRNDEPAVRYSRLDAQGNPRGEVRVIPDAGAEHADVCSVDKKVVIVWRAFDGQRMRYSAWVSRDDGATFEQRVLGFADDEADHPLLVRRGRELVAVWRTRTEIRAVRIAD